MLILYMATQCQPLPFDEIKFEHKVYSNEISNTPDESDIGYFLEVDLRYPYNIRQKLSISHCVLKINLFLKTILMII